MKFWVKITVAVCVVAVITFGVWAFFFREKDEVVAYNRTCEMVEYKETIGINDKLKDLQNFDYLGEDANNKIEGSSDKIKEILNLREVTLSDSIIKTYDDGGNVTNYFDSYFVMEENLDNMIKTLIPYIKHTNGNNNLNSSLKNSINDYTKNLKELLQTIESLNNCQKSISGSEVELDVLRGNYNNFRTKYRRCLGNSADIILDMFDIIKSNYKEIKFDTELTLIDSYARSVVVTVEEDKLREEAFFAHDSHLILDKYIKVNNNENIFSTEYNEYDYLKNYNNLFNNYMSELNKTFNKSKLGKTKMADGENLSDIKLEAQEPLIYVLNVLGY